MDLIKKYLILSNSTLLGILIITSLINLFSPFNFIEDIGMRWLASITFTLILGLFFSIIYLLRLEREVEKKFKKLADKYNATISRNGNAIDFRMKDERIRWSYTGPKQMRFYFKVNYKTEKEIDFRYNFGLLSLESRPISSKEEDIERKKEIKKWRKGLKKQGYVLNKIHQHDDMITFWIISRNVDLENVIKIKETVPYV